MRPPPFRAAQGRDGEGLGFYRASHRSEEQKHPTPALPFACGEREGAERLSNAFGSKEVLIHSSRLGGEVGSDPLACHKLIRVAALR